MCKIWPEARGWIGSKIYPSFSFVDVIGNAGGELK
jgi:hypothetical protein